MKTLLCNGRVLAGDTFASGVSVLVEDGRIAALLPATQAPPDGVVRVDLGGDYLLPGFIDVQVNGGGGVLFNNAPTVDTLRTMVQAHRRFGTTAMLPTLISDRVEVMAQAIAATHQAIDEGVPGILGIHLEGPYLARARKGTHDAGTFRVPDGAERALATSLGNGVTLITLAPECVPAEVIAGFVRDGAVVAAGHSEASYEQARAGLQAGITGFTHLYNAMSPLQGRAPGVVGAALEDPHSWVGIIADGVHVHPASLRVALAAKPRGKVLLVTDAMPPVGADSPSYELYGETITAVDGVVRNAAGALAGSALDMATAVRNAVELLGMDLAEAARMASTYPAQFIGKADQLGAIAPGYQADLVQLDDTLQVRATWIAGDYATA